MKFDFIFLLLIRDIVARELKSALRSIKLSDQGVFVQASTLGSLEALLEFLKTSKIPVSHGYLQS
jgi:translation initiation factor 5B